MNLEILSNLIITKVHSATAMYTEKNTKIQRKNRPNRAIVIKYEGETVYTSGGKNYLNIYDFSRAFKNYVGISPSKY